MKLYIVDSKNIKKYDLPVEIEEFYSVDYIIPKTKEKTLLSFEPSNGKWMFKSNGIVNLYNADNPLDDNVILEPYEEYNLKVLGHNELVKMYALPDVKDLIYQLDVSIVNQISIGSDQSCNITYFNNSIGPQACVIVKQGEDWVLNINEPGKNAIYIDKKRCVNPTYKLKTGNILFICGFELVWMNQFIIINNPKSQVNVSGLQPYSKLRLQDISQIKPVSDEEQSVSLYKESDYFYHNPRIQEFVQEEEIEIDAPPATEPTIGGLQFDENGVIIAE